MKKWIAIFLLFFLGTGALVTADHVCGEQTGIGGKAGLSIAKTKDGDIAFCFFGWEGSVDLQR